LPTAPLAHTIPEFWHLIWQEKVQIIVMLNSAAEGKLKKSEIYWPEGSSREYGPFTVTLVECQVFADYTARTMQLQVKSLRYFLLSCTILHLVDVKIL